jgi:ribosome-binding ATPase YchF (GTP1/OBG family)
LEKIRDLVLFRYGATGVQDAIKKAVEVKGYIPVYPVRNLNKFTSDRLVPSLLSISPRSLAS